MLLLDSRGNGRSSVVLAQTWGSAATPRRRPVPQALSRRQHRPRLRTDPKQLVGADEPWSVLGQSYGGFCAVPFPSIRADCAKYSSPAAAPLPAAPSDYYRHTYPEVARKTRKHFARYPDDVALCTRILEHLNTHDVALPTGGRLTVRRFQQVGFMLGFDEGMETLHYLLEGAFCAGAKGDALLPPQRRETSHLRDQPDLAVLHEMCYTQAPRRAGRRSVHAATFGMHPVSAKAPSFTGE